MGDMRRERTPRNIKAAILRRTAKLPKKPKPLATSKSTKHDTRLSYVDSRLFKPLITLMPMRGLYLHLRYESI
jgi:hypothetical protein